MAPNHQNIHKKCVCVCVEGGTEPPVILLVNLATLKKLAISKLLVANATSTACLSVFCIRLEFAMLMLLIHQYMAC